MSPALDTLLTPRLDLVAATPERLGAEHADPTALAALLAVRMPSRWPPEYYDRQDIERYLARATESPDGVVWGLRYIIARPAAPSGVRALVGVAGFGSPPKANGVVEIGYAIVPRGAWQRLRDRGCKCPRRLRVRGPTGHRRRSRDVAGAARLHSRVGKEWVLSIAWRHRRARPSLRTDSPPLIELPSHPVGFGRRCPDATTCASELSTTLFVTYHRVRLGSRRAAMVSNVVCN
jgi:hypothetical protein